MKKRLTAKLTEEQIKHLYQEGMVVADNEMYDLLEEEQTYFDSEKGYATFKVIVRRESDGKYFKGEFQQAYAGRFFSDGDLTEVYPKMINHIIYE